MSNPHQARAVAESFGADADRYDRARPDYPQALIERISASLPGPAIVDVGCGTGIASRQFEAAGCTVLGVEVDERMAELARRTGLAVETSAFEAWDTGGRRFDGVVAAQTWHWIDPVAGAAKAAEALKPGGRLAVFWNVFQPAPELARAFAEVYRRVAPDLPFRPWADDPLDLYGGIFGKAADGLAAAFGEPEQWRVDWEREYTRDEWLDQVPTHGGHNRLPQAQQDDILEGLAAAVDALGGRFTMPYATVAVTALSSRA
jgi:SAM-dependent methyltransferase